MFSAGRDYSSSVITDGSFDTTVETDDIIRYNPYIRIDLNDYTKVTAVIFDCLKKTSCK